MPRRPTAPRSLFSRLARPLVVVSLALSVGGCASALERARKAKDQKDYPRAEQYYRTSISSDPEDKSKATQELSALKQGLAHNKLKKGDAGQRRAAVPRGARADAGDDKAQDGLGRALADQGKTDEAIAALSGAGGDPCSL